MIAAKLWGHYWKGCHVQVKCDNLACVYVVNTGRARDAFLLKCAREIWLIAAMHDFTITAAHITTTDNAVADALSRSQNSAREVRRFAELTNYKQFKHINVDASLFKLITTL